jgi:ribonuclease J
MLKVIPLGGLGEIGLNMMVLEYDQYILVLDAGLMFPEEYMHGVDVVIPDIHYLKQNQERVKALLLTHGHEDHIGAVPFLLRELNIPIYGTGFTLELLKEKLWEHELLDTARLHTIQPGEKETFGPFRIEFIRVNHSTIEGVGLAVETPEGVLVHSGDFRVDQTPADGRFTDLARFAHYGEQGVLALCSDSTNVEKEGHSLSERDVRQTIEALFESCPGRVIIAVFASNIARIQQIINLAIAYRRKIVLSGKSMRTNVRIAREAGLLHFPDDLEINESAVRNLQDDGVVVITTGSQGEPMSSLTRMSRTAHKHIKVKSGDTIIFSSRFIPGNERAITTIINNLYRLGAEVVYEKVSHIHSSGHAYREELKLMLNLVRPKYFIPVHGEYRHLVKHAQLAEEVGIPRQRSFVLENGTTVCFEKGEGHTAEQVHTGRILVDGKGVGDVGDLVLRDRRRLSGDGVVIALMAVDGQTGDIVYGPDIISRGFVFEDQGDSILEDAKCIILEIMDDIKGVSQIDWVDVGQDTKRRLKRFFYKIIERRPLILPIIIPV